MPNPPLPLKVFPSGLEARELYRATTASPASPTQKGMEPIARSRADAAPKCVAFRCILLHFGAPNSHSTSRHRSADEHKANLLTPVIRVTRVRTVTGQQTAGELSEGRPYEGG